MYAVIETGGKQYRVEVGTELQVELLDAEPGQSVTLDRILLVADGDETSIGRPTVADAAVEAEVVRRDRGEKLIVFKYRPKARTRVKKGHRQDYTVLRITDVKIGGKSAAEATQRAEQDRKSERQRLEEAAARQAAADAELAARLAAANPKPAEPPKRGRSRAAAAAVEPTVTSDGAVDAVSTTDDAGTTTESAAVAGDEAPDPAATTPEAPTAPETDEDR
jgi:large subunit ribosomal protein L21